MKTGVSVYCSTDPAVSDAVIERAARAGAAYAFTSLHIPEERGLDMALSARTLLSSLRDAGIASLVDVGPETYELLGCTSIEELAKLGVTHVRLDYGFSSDEVVRLSDTFHIVCNASTVSREDIDEWRRVGADLSRFTACHNFYPKRYTGLALEDIACINARFAALGMETMAFVPGDLTLRGPLHEGLPTAEHQRERASDIALNMLELAYGAGCDAVLVGDVDISATSWCRFDWISHGYVEMRCELADGYGYLRDGAHHDRPDSSAWVFRSQESRTSARLCRRPGPSAGAGAPRPAGSIAVSNTEYGRYAGEVEIARVDLPGDERMNVVGMVDAEDIRLLPFVRDGFGLKLVS